MSKKVYVLLAEGFELIEAMTSLSHEDLKKLYQ